MAKHINLNPTRTYANEDNAHKAVAKFGYGDEHRYIVQMAFVPGYAQPRYFPVFVNAEAACQAGIHFNFHVVG